MGAIGFLYLFMASLDVLFVFKNGFVALSREGINGFHGDSTMEGEENLQEKVDPVHPQPLSFLPDRMPPRHPMRRSLDGKK